MLFFSLTVLVWGFFVLCFLLVVVGFFWLGCLFVWGFSGFVWLVFLI